MADSCRLSPRVLPLPPWSVTSSNVPRPSSHPTLPLPGREHSLPDPIRPPAMRRRPRAGDCPRQPLRDIEIWCVSRLECPQRDIARSAAPPLS
ncbi:hypothetical protein MTP99_009349 [Tenebrio molitor]|nr:hypothetical protein MTP99_009349 [Tenebrio molitor]